MEGQIDALNHLLTMSQDTDVPINSLLTTMQQAGKTARQFGLDFGQTAAGLLGAFEDAGLDAEKTSTGLSLALKNLAKDGVGPVTGLQQTVTEIQRLHDAGRRRGDQPGDQHVRQGLRRLPQRHRERQPRRRKAARR